jgi:hypothetical protein
MIVFRSRNDVLVRSRDGQRFTLEEPLELVTETGTHYQVPPGSQTDGASTPRAMWTLLPPFGPYWLAALVHDAAYRATLERLDSGVWMPAFLTKDQCDSLLLDCMCALGVDESIREEIYNGVKFGGWKAFSEDRSLAPGASSP